VKGDPKLKGIFNIPKMGEIDLRHTPNSQIITRAVTEHLVNGKEPLLTVTECEDIQEFLLTQQVRGNWSVTWKDQELGKMVRFYKAELNGAPIMRTPLDASVKGNAGMVANSDSCVPLPDLPESFHTINDIDHMWYVRGAEELLDIITRPKKQGYNAVAKAMMDAGFTPTTIRRGNNDRKTPTLGTTDFTSMLEDETFAAATGRNFGVLGARSGNGETHFYAVENKYPSKTRATISNTHGFELLFGCNVEINPYTHLQRVTDETYFDQFYTDTELRKARA
jgi:FAD/FMN-containing dehydrogenase